MFGFRFCIAGQGLLLLWGVAVGGVVGERVRGD